MERVKNIFLIFFHWEYLGIHQAAFLLGFAALLSNLLGLYRDRLLASKFGAGAALDIYYASFKIPDFFYVMSLFIAASAALIPLFLKKEQEDKKAAENFINQILGVFFIIFSILALALYFLMPFFSNYIAPGFAEADKKEMTALSRILLLSPLFLGLSNVASSVIQSRGRFFVYALSPILYNAGIILGILFLQPLFGLKGLIYGVLAGAFLHFFIQMPALINLGFKFRPSFNFSFEALSAVLKISFPRALTLSLNQIVLAAITAFASLIGPGSIAVFNLASNLQSAPLMIIGASYATAAFPVLAKNALNQNDKQFLSQVESVLKHIIFWSLPIIALFIVLRAHIVRVILGAGNFGWVDTRLTAACLGILSLNILFQGLIMLYLRAFYAAGKTRPPLIAGLASAFLSIFSAFFLLKIFETSIAFQNFLNGIFRIQDLNGTAVLILAIAITLGGFLNLVLLTLFFAKDFGKLDVFSFWRPAGESMASGFVVAFTAYGFLKLSAGFFNLQTFAGIFLHGFIAGVLGLFFGALFLRLIRNREFSEIVSAFKTKFGRLGIIAAEPERLQ